MTTGPESGPAESAGMRHWRIITGNRQFYGRDYWTGEKARAWGGRDYLDGAPQETLAQLVRRHLLPDGGRILEAGCAFGYLTRNLRRDGYAAVGCDLSGYCLAHGAPEVRGCLTAASVLTLPYPDAAFDLVICMEVLEHLPEELVPAAVAELRRVTRGPLLVSVPTYGPDEFGHYGLHFHTDPENSDWWCDAVANRAFTRLDIDEATGEPRCGHLTHGTYRWWTERFRAQGLARDGEAEARIYDDPALDTRPWQLYIMRPAATAWQGELPTTVFAGGWADRGRLGDRPLRWSAPGEATLQVATGAPAVELELFAGPRRLTHPYTLFWQTALAQGEVALIPGERVRLRVPVATVGRMATIALRGGSAWTTAMLFGGEYPAAPSRGSWALLGLQPATERETLVTRRAGSDWQPDPPPVLAGSSDSKGSVLDRMRALFT